MLVAAILLACALLDSLILVSQLSFANAVSHLIVNAIMLIYCLSEIRNWSLGSVTFRLDIQTLPTMIGVVVFGYTSHIFLPSLEGSMQVIDPSSSKQFLIFRIQRSSNGCLDGPILQRLPSKRYLDYLGI